MSARQIFPFDFQSSEGSTGYFTCISKEEHCVQTSKGEKRREILTLAVFFRAPSRTHCTDTSSLRLFDLKRENRSDREHIDDSGMFSSSPLIISTVSGRTNDYFLRRSQKRGKTNTGDATIRSLLSIAFRYGR